MPTKSYAATWRGVTVTRRSAGGRDYAFVTVSLGHSQERERQILEGELKICDENLAYWRGRLDGGDLRHTTTEQLGRDIRRNVERRAIVEAKLANPKAIQDIADRVCEWGWSSRRDLAEKNAAKATALGYRQATVLAVDPPTVSTPRARKSAPVQESVVETTPAPQEAPIIPATSHPSYYYPELSKPFRSEVLPTFPDTCPACGAEATARGNFWHPVTYACGGAYVEKPQIQNHTDYWWGKCPAQATVIQAAAR